MKIYIILALFMLGIVCISHIVADEETALRIKKPDNIKIKNELDKEIICVLKWINSDGKQKTSSNDILYIKSGKTKEGQALQTGYAIYAIKACDANNEKDNNNNYHMKSFYRILCNKEHSYFIVKNDLKGNEIIIGYVDENAYKEITQDEKSKPKKHGIFFD